MSVQPRLTEERLVRLAGKLQRGAKNDVENHKKKKSRDEEILKSECFCLLLGELPFEGVNARK